MILQFDTAKGYTVHAELQRGTDPLDGTIGLYANEISGRTLRALQANHVVEISDQGGNYLDILVEDLDEAKVVLDLLEAHGTDMDQVAVEFDGE